MWYTWRFSPVWSSDRSQTQQEEYERKKKIRCWLRVGALFILVAAIYFSHRWLADNSVRVSEQAIVYLTLVLLFVTYLQWDVAALQNIAIERQLYQMQFQQRAWLATSAIEIEELVTGLRENQKSVDISKWGIKVSNTGSTPGIITHSRIEPVLKPIGDNCKENLAELEVRAREVPPRRTVVAPGFPIIFRLNDDGGSVAWGEGTIQQIRNRSYLAYLIGVFIYEDVFGDEHKTLCAYRYAEETKQLENKYQDGDMT